LLEWGLDQSLCDHIPIEFVFEMQFGGTKDKQGAENDNDLDKGSHGKERD
jgi:hypothetical protein